MGPGQLDLEVFQCELGRARAVQAVGDLAGAADALGAALALWRGQPCDGLTSPLLDSERERLIERQIRTVEDRVEVDLALGRHLDLVEELRRHTAEQPLRERLRGQLMLALYRSSRQADALAAFHETRRYLRDELGIEPGAELQRLHEQILTGDPALAPPAPLGGSGPRGRAVAGRLPGSEAGPGLPAPAQLPSGVPDFTGRDAELNRLHDLVAAGGGTVLITVITGTAGVGKTALAVHWAHQIRDRFPDGQLYVNLRGFGPTGSAMEPGEAIRGFLDAFAVPPHRIPAGLEAQSALCRSLLADRRVLVVLDNVEDADQVRPLLPGAPGCLVVITSRNKLTGLVAAEGARAVAMGLLSTAEARQLLTRRLGLDRVAAEPDAVDDIIALCARLPLALTIVAARAATQPGFSLALLAAKLRETRGSLDAFTIEDRAADVRAAFSWSYQRLSPGAARLFRLLGVHPGPDIAAPAAASLLAVPVAQVRLLLAELARAHLVDEYVPGRFAFHDLLRVCAAELTHELDDDGHRQAAVRRVLDFYIHTAYIADRLLNPYRDPYLLPPPEAGVGPLGLADPGAAMAWFTAEHHVLLAAVEQVSSSGFDDRTGALVWTLGTFLDGKDRHGAAAGATRVP